VLEIRNSCDIYRGILKYRVIANYLIIMLVLIVVSFIITVVKVEVPLDLI
jgi:hypothetical protein